MVILKNQVSGVVEMEVPLHTHSCGSCQATMKHYNVKGCGMLPQITCATCEEKERDKKLRNDGV